MILWNFKAILWNFVARLFVFFLTKSCFWKNWMLSMQTLYGWIMFYSARWLIAETWKRILHGRNGSNLLVNSKKSWKVKIIHREMFCQKPFWNVVAPAHEVKIFKGIVKSAEPCKCVILLVSRILWRKRINPLKVWRFWYLLLTGNFPPQFLLSSLHSAIPVKVAYLHWKKLVT